MIQSCYVFLIVGMVIIVVVYIFTYLNTGLLSSIQFYTTSYFMQEVVSNI